MGKKVCSKAGSTLRKHRTSSSGRTLSYCGKGINKRTGKLKKGYKYKNGRVVKVKK